MDNACCPIVAGAPEVMKAAFTKEVDFFAARKIEFVDPAVSFVEPNLMARRMFETWGPRLGITEDESDHACREAWKALTIFENDLEEKGRAILETVEAERQALFVAPLCVPEDTIEVLLVGCFDAAHRLLKRSTHVLRRAAHVSPVTALRDLKTVFIGEVTTVLSLHRVVLLVPHIADAFEEEKR